MFGGTVDVIQEIIGMEEEQYQKVSIRQTLGHGSILCFKGN